jgi:membrane-bound serine protease (ClpP class)
MKRLLWAVCVLGILSVSLQAATSEQATNSAPVASKDGVVYIVPIRGMIEPALLYVIRRGLDEADAVKASAVVFVMDTPGGTLEAASEIVRTIQQISVPTYTFVEKNAFSAGAIIALATDHIYMAPGSVIGDAMPIMMSPFGQVQEMSEDMREKIVSAVAALVRAAAEQSGHRVDVAEKMVRREIELKIGEEVISPSGRLLTLTNQEAERTISAGGEPLLSAGTVEDVDALLKRIGLENATRKELQVTPIERIARFIAAAAPLFLIVGLLGIYIEVRTPGFGLPGMIGIVCLAIFFWGHHIAGLAGMEEILLFVVGAVLLAVEILFIPGFGVVGVTGIVLMLASLISAMVRRYPAGPWIPMWTDLQWPLAKLALAVIATAGLGALMGPLLPNTFLFNRLVLFKATRRSEGFAAAPDQPSLLGCQGVTLSPLRPSGTARFGDQKRDVITQGDFVEAGRPVRIVETHGSRIIVEEVK